MNTVTDVDRLYNAIEINEKRLYNKCWGYSYKSSRQHFLLQ